MLYPLRHYSNGKFDTTDMIFLGVFIIIAIIVSFFTRKAIVRRNLKKAPLRRLADFKYGETAKIVGTVEFIDEPLEAPLSGRECSWYYVHIQIHRGKNSYANLIQAQEKCRFVLREGDKVAYVNHDNIKSYIVKDVEYRSGFLNDATQRLEAYLKKHGHRSENFLGMNKGIRYSEGVLEKGEVVAVLGKGEWRDAETLGLPREYGLVLAITEPADNPIYLSDDADAVTIHGMGS